MNPVRAEAVRNTKTAADVKFLKIVCGKFT